MPTCQSGLEWRTNGRRLVQTRKPRPMMDDLGETDSRCSRLALRIEPKLQLCLPSSDQLWLGSFRWIGWSLQLATRSSQLGLIPVALINRLANDTLADAPINLSPLPPPCKTGRFINFISSPHVRPAYWMAPCRGLSQTRSPANLKAITTNRDIAVYWRDLRHA